MHISIGLIPSLFIVLMCLMFHLLDIIPQRLTTLTGSTASNPKIDSKASRCFSLGVDNENPSFSFVAYPSCLRVKRSVTQSILNVIIGELIYLLTLLV